MTTMMARKNIGPETEVWTATARWCDCDPSEAVVALTKKACLKKINAAILEMAKRAYDDDDSHSSLALYMDDIMWSCYKETLRDAVFPRQLDEAIEALANDGCFYPELS